jgi:hypothetical protein
MRIRLVKKLAEFYGLLYFWQLYTSRKERKKRNYKKGWSRLEEHHDQNRSRGGNSSRANTRILSGKTSFCWHQIFGNLDHKEAKQFIFYFLCGNKTEWQADEICNLRNFIGHNQFNEAAALCLLQGKKMQSGISRYMGGNFLYDDFKIENIEANKNFVDCWNFLFYDLNVVEIQVFLSLFFEGKRRRWKVADMHYLRQSIKNGQIKKCHDLCMTKKGYSTIVYNPCGFVPHNAVSLAA